MKALSQLVPVLAMTLLLGSLTPVHAQSNQRPIRLVVGTPPGASLDTLSRLVADKIKVTLDRPVIVENKAGASGRIAAETVKSAPPDGETIWITASANVVAQPLAYSNLKYDPFKDFVPVSQLASFQMVLAVPNDASTQTLADYIANAKRDPSRAMYASPSAGSLLHFLGVMLSQETGVPLTHVPYQGTAQILPALMGNHVPGAFLVISDATQPHRNGRFRVLAASGESRSKYLPDVPTFKESGLSNVVGVAWFAAYAPAGTPQAVVDTISKAMADAMQDTDVRQKLDQIGLDPIGTTSRELATIHRNEVQKLAPVIKASGFKGEP